MCQVEPSGAPPDVISVLVELAIDVPDRLSSRLAV